MQLLARRQPATAEMEASLQVSQRLTACRLIPVFVRDQALQLLGDQSGHGYRSFDRQHSGFTENLGIELDGELRFSAIADNASAPLLMNWYQLDRTHAGAIFVDQLSIAVHVLEARR